MSEETGCPKCTHCKTLATERKRREKAERGTTALYAASHGDRLDALAAMSPQEITEWFRDLSVADATMVIAAAPSADRESMLERLAPNVVDTVRIHVHADELPVRVRISSDVMSYRPRPLPVDHATAVRLCAVGLGVIVTDDVIDTTTNRAAKRSTTGGSIESVRSYAFAHPFELDRGVAVTIDRQHFDLCVEVDAKLAQLIKLGHVKVEDLDHAANVAHELTLRRQQRNDAGTHSRIQVHSVGGIGVAV